MRSTHSARREQEIAKMTSWQARAGAAAKALIVAAGSAYNVATGDIQQAAFDISKDYANTTSRQIEDEIKRHIRK
jgi:hypothetical protein